MLQQDHSCSQPAGVHKVLCWCCSPFYALKSMETGGWMDQRGGPCYPLAANLPSLAKQCCTCTATSWRPSDKGKSHTACTHSCAKGGGQWPHIGFAMQPAPLTREAISWQSCMFSMYRMFHTCVVYFQYVQDVPYKLSVCSVYSVTLI